MDVEYLEIQDVDRGDSAMVLLDLVSLLLERKGNVRSIKTTPYPFISHSDYIAKLSAKLLDQRRHEIGEVRALVRVPNDGDNAFVTIDWTRDLFGFWYREEVRLHDGAIDPEGVFVSPLKRIVEHIRWTAEGTVQLKSMVRFFDKVDKDRIQDRKFNSGIR